MRRGDNGDVKEEDKEEGGRGRGVGGGMRREFMMKQLCRGEAVREGVVRG